uniref:Uncharacterized protein n=1 Tax=Varanus komodoensis TaxID=61221 RepID=A0A8D2J3C8_VARKO
MAKTEIFAVFNKAKTSHRSSQYYTVTIPVKIISNGQSICSLEANWLEHMTEHFRKGSTLVNAIFSLGMVNDSSQGMTDGIFIFEDLSVEDSKSIQGYDAIVVEQWTVLEVSRREIHLFKSFMLPLLRITYFLVGFLFSTVIQLSFLKLWWWEEKLKVPSNTHTHGACRTNTASIQCMVCLGPELDSGFGLHERKRSSYPRAPLSSGLAIRFLGIPLFPHILAIQEGFLALSAVFAGVWGSSCGKELEDSPLPSV